ncbi:MAG: LLM class flavin-dependent oxidoreductase [Candidatus Dormibacteraeota bacterium]|nr:LLM class flavin-dependent oxidoreductase [Candidatus Dormibacteraeota bacterium]
MAELGVMIEAQEGLDWDQWRRIVADAERLGFAALRTSDHCFSVMGVTSRHSLAAWPALALAAEWSSRIQLAPMVSPITFYQPAMLARFARAVDELAGGGRVMVGVGTGWYQGEHEAFGLPFPSLSERFRLLEEGIDRIRRTLEDHPLPFLIGARGEKKGLPLVARHASEWNTMAMDADSYRAKADVLAECCRSVGRDPGEIRHSVMSGYLIGRDQADLRERAARFGRFMPGMEASSPDEVLAGLRQRFFVGTPEDFIGRIRPLAQAGVSLFMFQHFLYEDSDALELLASEVMPAVQAM